MDPQHPRYQFKSVENCNMCGSPRDEHRVLGKRLNGSQGVFPRGKRGITTTVVKCRRCGLIFPDPMPIPFDLQDHYGLPPEQYWREEYFDVSETYFLDVINRLRVLAKFRPGMTALDIGAGLGKAMVAMERAGFDAHGFEASVPFRNRAIERMGIDPMKLRLGDIETISYEPASFDFISFGAVLEHLFNPAASLQKALGWLKPGGLIHAEVPSSDWLISRIVNFAYRIQGADYVGNVSPMHAPFHLYEFTLASFEANGRRQGYEVATHEYYVCQTYMPRMLNSLLRWCMRHTSTGMQLSVWLRSIGRPQEPDPGEEYLGRID